MYYIYHIPGIKIGVSQNPDRRVKRQGYSEYEIIEKHNNIKSASYREIELQKEYGYPVDTILYYKFVDGTRQSKGGKKIGYQNGKLVTSRPEWIDTAKKGGYTKAGYNNGLAKLKHNELSINGKKGGTKSSKNLNTFMGGYITCQHCNKKMNKGNYNRWHGDKCKDK